ncbi:MAG: alkaline phosphatase family protein [Acidimicrobiia bacterium]
MADGVARRSFLLGLGAASGLALAGCRPWRHHDGHGSWRLGQPGDRPNPWRAEGTDLLPQVEHIVIYMQENHSYDSYFGMFHRGDGYCVRNGVATNSNRDPEGNQVVVHHAGSTCQLGQGVGQSWVSTHRQIDGGRMDGFVADGNTNAMKYWDGSDLPFYWSLADTFPLCDRWFAYAPAQTYPNRMYLQAATCQDLVATDTAKAFSMPHPAGGTIWDKLNAHGISWHDYAFDLPDIALYPTKLAENTDKLRTFPQFLADCRSGSLPAVSIVSPGVAAYSEENPSDIQLGEAYSASIVNAIMGSPAWPKTVLLFMYDEHGGYYDHVPPPPAVPPDNIAPAVTATPDVPAAWNQYGLRVPAFVISPFAKRNYISHVVHDHTSVLRFIETKFNLGALTRRDANADNLLDCFDFRHPGFIEPPTLAAPGLPTSGSSCQPQTPPPPTTSAGAVKTMASVKPATDSQDQRHQLLARVSEAGLVTV